MPFNMLMWKKASELTKKKKLEFMGWHKDSTRNVQGRRIIEFYKDYKLLEL
jgi:hypothetical protein